MTINTQAKDSPDNVYEFILQELDFLRRQLSEAIDRQQLLSGVVAPRFSGGDPTEWIFGIERYYDLSLTTESDRLELVPLLIDSPASEWLCFFQKNNPEASWQEFLLALRRHFDPDFYEDDVDRFSEDALKLGPKFAATHAESHANGPHTPMDGTVAGVPISSACIGRSNSTCSSVDVVLPPPASVGPTLTNQKVADFDDTSNSELTKEVDEEKQLGGRQSAPESDNEVSQVIVDSQFGTQRVNVASTDIFANESGYKSIISNGSLNMNLKSNNMFANGIDFDMDAINDVGTPKSYTDRSVDTDLQLPNCEMDGGNLQVAARHIQGVFVDAETLIDLYGDARAIPPRNDALLLRRNPIIGTAMPSLSSRLPIKIEPRANPLKDFGHDDSAAVAVPFSILHSVEPRGLFDTLTVHNQTSVSLDFLGGSTGGYTLLGQTAYRAWPDVSDFLPPIIMSQFILHHVPDSKDSAQLYQIVSEIELTHLLPKQSIKWPKVGTYKDMTVDGYSIFVKSGQHGKVILPQEVPMYQLAAISADGRSIPPREHLGRKSSSRRHWRLPPSQTPHPSSSFELLRNCVADTGDDSLEFSSVVCRRCDPSYYTIYLEERREYKLHEDEHGKDFVRCVAFFNKVRILFQITLLKFGSCYTRALENCSCLNRFGCQMMNQLQYNVGGPNVQEFRGRCWGNVVVDGGSNLQGVLAFVLHSGSTRTRQGHETLGFGAMKGVHIFDPGDFKSTFTLDETLMFLFHYPP